MTEVNEQPVCPAALLSASLALVPAYCLPATPLHSLSLGAGHRGRASVARVDQLPQLTLLTLSSPLQYSVDCG